MIEWNIGAQYKSLGDDGQWLPCPKCNERPRIWVFDNGRSAKCKCDGMYSEARVKAESVFSVMMRSPNKQSAVEYDPDELRKNWNVFVETGVRHELQKGRW